MDTLVMVAFSAILVIAAGFDFACFRIPNNLIVAVLTLYPAWVLVSPQPQPWLISLGIFAVTLLIAMIGFRFGLFGAGDGKLLAAVLLWAGPDHATDSLLIMALSGGLLGLFYGTSARFVIATTFDRLGTPVLRDNLLANRLPYGIAIAVGGLYFAIGVVRRIHGL